MWFFLESLAIRRQISQDSLYIHVMIAEKWCNATIHSIVSYITLKVWIQRLVYFQFFLSNRAVYLLLWNVRLGYDHAGLDFWLNSIACHAPKSPILVVGTHVDKVRYCMFYTRYSILVVKPENLKQYDVLLYFSCPICFFKFHISCWMRFICSSLSGNIAVLYHRLMTLSTTMLS